MTRLVVATGNAGKTAEIRIILDDLPFEVQSLKDLENPPEIVEDADSFAGNAIIKAEAISAAYGIPVLADDSGLVVDALDGRPGVLSARYGGPGLSDKERYEKLLEELLDVPFENRTARFRCAIAYARPGFETAIFEGTVEGRIARAPTGSNGFGYDPIFVPDGHQQSMAELSPEIKKMISHRGRALKVFKDWLKAAADLDRWVLTRLFQTDDAFERALSSAADSIDGYARFRGTLEESAGNLSACLEYDARVNRDLERLGSYAFLRSAEDLNDSHRQSMLSRYRTIATRISEAASYISPEILALPVEIADRYLAAPELALYSVMLSRLFRMRPHTLSPAEERLLAMQGELRGAAGTIFRQLNDADFSFGRIKDLSGATIELTHGNWSSLIECPSRKVRASAFKKMFAVYDSHANALAAMLDASVRQNVVHCRIRNFSSAREASLFADNVSIDVYDRLIRTIRAHIHVNHRYLSLVRRKLGLRALHFYDTYVPLASPPAANTPWDAALSLITDSLAPLGTDYCDTLREGLTGGRWVDIYEKPGKRSGAFSAGGYDSPPYILMNYRPDSLRSVYTLAHEAGHSMHTLLSARNQPFVNYEYAIFVAEVASTFNEQLLTRHLLLRATDPATRAFIIDREINQIRTTLIRQTMFAEFEKRTHEIVEAGGALTLDTLKHEYTLLLRTYFGEEMVIDPALQMEWARIPHFYNAFYVYKYATGIASAISLCDDVQNEGEAARVRYLCFLKSGGSAFPLDQLRAAGVDLSSDIPVSRAMERLDRLVSELEDLLPR